MTEWNHRAGIDEMDDPTIKRDEQMIKQAIARTRRNDASELRRALIEFLDHYEKA